MKNPTKLQVQRYPLYLKFLEELLVDGKEIVSASEIGYKFGYSQEQVRKDFQAISTVSGKPRKGREIKQLIQDLSEFLGYSIKKKAIVMGVGRLGGALMHYPYFSEAGLEIVAGFDSNSLKNNREVEGKPIYACADFDRIISTLKPDIAIITVPANQAQRVTDLVIKGGVKGIWNFAPIKLVVPDGIALENVNLTASLAVLTHNLK